MEFRILNAYRDGDMKAHRREAKNTALIECVQVAAEKAKWPLREEFRRASSRQGGGGCVRRGALAKRVVETVATGGVPRIQSATSSQWTSVAATTPPPAREASVGRVRIVGRKPFG